MQILNTEGHLLWMSNVHIVLGAKKSLILDAQRQESYSVPLSFAHFFLENNRGIYSVILKNLKEEDRAIALNYINMSMDKGFVKIVDQELLDLFPNTKIEYYDPYVISNLIITLSDQNVSHCVRLVKNELYSLGVQAIQVRGKSDLLKILLPYLKNTKIRDVEIIILDMNEIQSEEIEKILSLCPLISTVYVTDKQRFKYLEKKGLELFCVGELNNSYLERTCGAVKKEWSAFNNVHFVEALKYNTCLNKKVSIGSFGDIKNCPSMPDSYGNIKDTTLVEAIEKPGFTKYWNINKDQIAVCKDCEFRYICTDCRAYVEDPNDTSGSEGTNLSKPLKCGYNPYTGEWSEWSKSILKKKLKAL